MSRKNGYRNWLLASSVLSFTLCLTASSLRSSAPAAIAQAAQSSAQVAQTSAQVAQSSAPVARTGSVQPHALALLPSQFGIATPHLRHRFIVQSDSAKRAREAVSRAGGL